MGPPHTRADRVNRWYGGHVAPGRPDTARSPWEEWAIRGAIALLFAVGVAAIWGESIRDWIASFGGSSEGGGGAVERARGPAGGTL